MTPVDLGGPTAPAAEPHADESLAAPSAPDDLATTIARLVGPAQRVLLIGATVEGIAGALRAGGCQVTVAGVSRPADPAANGAVIVEPGEVIDLPPAADEQRFEAAVIVDTLTRLRDPARLLRAAGAAVGPAGRVVVSVPNAGHGDLLLALWRGESPYAAAGVREGEEPRLVTRGTLIELCEAAGLVLGQLERLERPVAAGAGAATVPSALVEALARNPDARTARFVAVAYPLPRPELAFLQERMRELVLALAAAQRAAAELQPPAADSAARGLDRARSNAPVADAGAAASRPAGDDPSVLEQTVREQADHIAALTARLEAAARREIELRDRLIEAHDQLLRRDDDIQFLRRGETRPPPPTLYHRVRNVYARLQWVPGIRLPLLAIRRLRRQVRGDRGRR